MRLLLPLLLFCAVVRAQDKPGEVAAELREAPPERFAELAKRTLPSQEAFRSACSNWKKFRTVEEAVKVTQSICPASSCAWIFFVSG